MYNEGMNRGYRQLTTHFTSVLVLTALAAILFTSCSSDKSGYEALGMKFYKLKDISGYSFLEDYSGTDNAYLCIIEDTSETELTIPSQVDGISVVAVSTRGAGSGSLEKLTFSEGILYIENGFDRFSALKEINFPSTLKKISNSFNYLDSIESADIPENTEVISSFENCPNLPLAEGPIEPPAEEWGNDLFNEAVSGLIDSGDVSESAIDASDLFEFDDDGNIVFGSAEAKVRLTSASPDITGKVIWGCYSIFSREVSVLEKSPNDTDESTPRFTPVGVSGDAPFASSVTEADYFIVYTGLISRVESEFYDNGHDRNTMTTIVMVIDCNTREVIHIENIGSDRPGIVTSDTTGAVMTDDATAYMTRICS